MTRHSPFGDLASTVAAVDAFTGATQPSAAPDAGSWADADPRGVLRPMQDADDQDGTAPPAEGAGSATARPGAEGFDLSHDQLALDLGAASFDLDARHVATWNAWLHWQDTHWRRDDHLQTFTIARKFCRARAQEVQAWAEATAATETDARAADKLRGWAKAEGLRLKDKRTIAAVIDLARSNPASAAVPDDFDRDPMLLATPGGTVDLRTGQLRRARRVDLITKIAGAAPAAGKPEAWLRFLDSIFDGDREVIAFLRRAAGYSLTGDVSAHKLLFCYGTGANGKSTFLNALFGLLGDYARRAAATTFLNRQTEGHPTDLAGLAGARLVVASELPRGATWNESVIKDLTGGDRMTARYMRGDFFDFDPVLKLWISGNTQPSFKGVDEAMRRRVVLVPFRVTIPPEDRDEGLPARLQAELGQIMAWAIEGCLDWQDGGLRVPAGIAAASADYLDDEDIVAQFLADETEPDMLQFVTMTRLHERFGQWCERQGLRSWTLRTLRKELVSRGLQDARRSAGNGFTGLRLK